MIKTFFDHLEPFLDEETDLVVRSRRYNKLCDVIANNEHIYRVKLVFERFMFSSIMSKLKGQAYKRFTCTWEHTRSLVESLDSMVDVYGQSRTLGRMFNDFSTISGLNDNITDHMHT
ncbi:hypothetical protein QEN19_003516 [Hanseniaspora menglaensis]